MYLPNCMILLYGLLSTIVHQYLHAVHNRAMRFSLGVGKYTPYDAVSVEMAWKPTSVRQWKSVCLYWSKLAAMGYSRLNKRIALWTSEKSSRSVKIGCILFHNFLLLTTLGIMLI